MKKGFTIIEIIISIGIILIVGVSTTFFVFNRDNSEDIAKKILEAANAYIKVEKDSNGNIYANEIIKGAQGVQVPLSNLVNAGYIDEKLANEVYEKNDELEDTQDYYVLFVQEIGGENESYCNENEITSYVSWMPKGDNIYLCNAYSKPVGGEDPEISDNVIEYILQYEINVGTVFYKKEIDYAYSHQSGGYGDSSGSGGYFSATSYYKPYDGVYKRCDIESCNVDEYTYFYRGVDVNNFLNIPVSELYCGNSLTCNKKKHEEEFRIVSFNKNEIKLIGGRREIEADWMDDLIDAAFVCPDGVDKDICLDNKKRCFKEVSSCDDELINNYSPTYTGICENIVTYDVGHLTEWDAIHAGVAPERCSYFEHNIISVSWLSLNQYAFRLYGSDFDPSYSYIHKIQNPKILVGNNFKKLSMGYLCVGAVSTFDTEYYISDWGALWERPVIALDPNEITLTGSGTESDPFVVGYKID